MKKEHSTVTTMRKVATVGPSSYRMNPDTYTILSNFYPNLFKNLLFLDNDIPIVTDEGMAYGEVIAKNVNVCEEIK